MSIRRAVNSSAPLAGHWLQRPAPPAAVCDPRVPRDPTAAAEGLGSCWGNGMLEARTGKGFKKRTLYLGRCWRIRVQWWLRNARGLHIQCCSLPEGLCQTELSIAFLAILLTRPIVHSTASDAKTLGEYAVGARRPGLAGPLPSVGSLLTLHSTPVGSFSL